MRASPPSAADVLRRHFVAQDLRPSNTLEIPHARLSAWQRALIVCDGTLTSLVEAHTLEPVRISQLRQCEMAPDALARQALGVPPRSVLLGRNVLLTGEMTDQCFVAADSVMVRERLPARFLEVLDQQQRGLGAALLESRIETRRELLWHGLVVDGVGRVLQRAYRLFISDRPVLLVRECFLPALAGEIE